MPSYYATPLTLGQLTPSLRASHYRRPRKRQRDDDELDDVDSSDSGPSTEKHAYLHPAADMAQLNVAGLSPGASLPPAPFPHAPPRSSKAKVNVGKELASLNPPIYIPNQHGARKSHRTHTRQHHLAVMAAILHRCLAEGDYERASRALGMLLRSHAGGKSVDIRTNGRWGIGAEILLRRQTDPAPDGSPFSPQSLKAARNYYERLVLQYPTMKNHPNSLNASVFYPALFSIWILEVSQSGSRRRRYSKTFSSRSKPFDAESTASDSEDVDEQAVEEELVGARKIAEELDKLLVSPPYDKSPDLLQLRGMVSLWLGDLLDAIQRHSRRGTRDTYDVDVDSRNGKRYQVKEALRTFLRAKQNGAKLWKGAEDLLHVDEDEDDNNSTL